MEAINYIRMLRKIEYLINSQKYKIKKKLIIFIHEKLVVNN